MQENQTIPAMENKAAGSRKKLWPLLIVIAVCAAPMIFSYLTYYVIKPEGRTNYGDLIDPRAYPIPALSLTTLDSKPASLHDFGGKWILLQVDGAACGKPCEDRLYYMRQ